MLLIGLRAMRESISAQGKMPREAVNARCPVKYRWGSRDSHEAAGNQAVLPEKYGADGMQEYKSLKCHTSRGHAE